MDMGPGVTVCNPLCVSFVLFAQVMRNSNCSLRWVEFDGTVRKTRENCTGYICPFWCKAMNGLLYWVNLNWRKTHNGRQGPGEDKSHMGNGCMAWRALGVFTGGADLGRAGPGWVLCNLQLPRAQEWRLRQALGACFPFFVFFSPFLLSAFHGLVSGKWETFAFQTYLNIPRIALASTASSHSSEKAHYPGKILRGQSNASLFFPFLFCFQTLQSLPNSFSGQKFSVLFFSIVLIFALTVKCFDCEMCINPS